MGIDQKASDSILPFQDITEIFSGISGVGSSTYGKRLLLKFNYQKVSYKIKYFILECKCCLYNMTKSNSL